MSSIPVDPAAIRAGLERQLALFAPVADHLLDASTRADPLIAEDWRGPAADAAAAFLADLRAELGIAADEAGDVVRMLRVHIAVLS